MCESSLKIEHWNEHRLQLMVYYSFDPEIFRSYVTLGTVLKVLSNVRLFVVSHSWHRQQQNHICKRNKWNNYRNSFRTHQEYLEQRVRHFQVLQNYRSYFQYYTLCCICKFIQRINNIRTYSMGNVIFLTTAKLWKSKHKAIWIVKEAKDQCETVFGTTFVLVSCLTLFQPRR